MINTWASQQPAFRGGGAGGWTPSDLGDKLFAWWDAEYLPSMEINGGAVGAWADRKNGLTVTQAITARKPTWVSNGVYNRPGVLYDASDDGMSFSGANVLPAGSSYGEIWALVSQTTDSTTSDRRIIDYGATIATVRQLIKNVDSGVNRARVVIGNGSSVQSISEGTIDFSGDAVLRGVISPTTSYIEIREAASVPITIVPATVSTNIGIGCARSGIGQTWGGAINSIIITDELTSEELAALRTYIDSRRSI